MKNLQIFGMNSSRPFAQQVARYLDMELSSHEEDCFADNECYVRSNVNVRDYDVYVIQSLYSCCQETVADKFLKLLFFIGSLRDASARRITAVIPYLGYSRQDRKTESRAPITTKYVAQLLESVRVDRVLTMDVHNLSALQNAFRVPTDNLESKNLLADWTAGNVTDPENLVVLSPDSGGMGRSKRFRNTLKEKLKVEVPLAYLDKTHTGRLIQGHSIIGSVKDKDVVILDDMISSGSTIRESYNAVLAHGGRVFAAEATHGLFVGKVNENLNGVERVVITDTIDSAPRVSKDVQQKLHIISTSRMFSQAIRRIHEEGGSISDLLK